jgi:penicillin-binding protein 1A
MSITKQKKKKYSRILWLLFILGIIAVSLYFFLLSKSNLPSFEDLENPEIPYATTLYTSDDQVLGRYYVENRVNLPFEELNPYLVDALIATEDIRYKKHAGIDFRALGRVFVKNVLLGKTSAGGGSTITQQLAKLLYERPDFSGKGKLRRMWIMVNTKFKEWITAVKLERSYTKEEIIAMYLNEFEFIYNAFGIQAAAETYFGKDQKDLSIDEAATLVGMLKNPYQYNPKINPENSKNRRNVVIDQMRRNDIVNKELSDSLKLLPLDISNFNRSSHITGPAPYCRMEARKMIKDILSRPENKKADGSMYDIYRDGLNIHLTIDSRYQKHAEKAMMEHMPDVQKRFWGEWKNLDPYTYEADAAQRKIRRESLDKLVRESGRYAKLRTNILSETLVDVEEKFNISLRDVDILRLKKAEKNKGHITRLLSSKYISRDMASAYREILKSQSWPLIKEKWDLLEKSVKTEFDKPVKMKVFTWGPKMEKDTVMSPLDSIKYHRMFLHLGGVAIDPHNGQIKAWVGGINHKYFKYDHVTSHRQVGSTFKPFIYASAIGFQAISPCHEIVDQQYTIVPGEGSFGLLEPWIPSNANEFTGETVNMYEGLRLSLNAYSVYLMKQLGSTEPVISLAHNMGIDSSARLSNNAYVLPRSPSICLGAADLRVLDMAGAYTTFANNGVYSKPYLIERIEDPNGKVIFEAYPEETVALNNQTNYVMVELLKHALSTAGGFSKIKSVRGGKTGTTNDYTDGWFMGFTPEVVIGAWVGGEDRWIRFRSLANGQGSRMARPFFSKMLEKLENDPDIKLNLNKDFRKPAGELDITIDCETYKENLKKLGNPWDTSNEDENKNENEDDDYFE